MPSKFYSENADAGNGSVLSGELVLAGQPWDLSGINGTPPQSFTILIRGSRNSATDEDNYIIRQEDLILAPGTVLGNYAVDISFNGRPGTNDIAFNSGSRPFSEPPNPFGNYTRLTGLFLSGSNYLRYTLSGSSFFGVTVNRNNILGEYSLELSLVYIPTATQIPKLSVFARSASVQNEGNSGVTNYIFTIHRTGLTSGTTSVNWAIAGAGTNPTNTSDFAPGSALSGLLTFLPTETEKLVTVQVAGDTTFEADEAFDLILSGASAGTEIIRTSQRAVITNDDATPPPATLAISPASADKVEGTGATPTPFTFSVARTGDTSTASSALWTVAGSGTNPATASDFTGNALPTGTVSFAPGQTSATITIGVNADSTIEPDEAFLVTLSNPSGASLAIATASGTIRNDDVPPPPPPPPPPAQSTVAIVVSTNGSEAGSIPSLFTITRTGNLSSSLSVPWSKGGSAFLGIDFNGPTSGVLVFPAGSALATLTIPTLDDTFRDPNETLTISLSPPAGTSVTPGGSLSATAVQVDDESIAPVVTDVVFGGHDGRLALGEGISLTVTFSKTVVAGTGVDLPRILLNSGGRAAYISGSGTTQLVFRYVPAAGDITSDLATAAASALSGILRDLAGNDVVASGFNNRRPTGPLVVDTLAPSVTGFTFSRNSGSLALGASLTLTITFSETVIVPGSGASAPSVLLNNGGRATYVSGSGTNQLLFSYIPAAGQSVPALATATANALAGTIRDVAGNAAAPAGFTNRRPTGTLRVDTLAPAVTGCAFSRNSGVLAVGTSLFLTITFSETVVVPGIAPGSGAAIPSILLNNGGRATYVSGSGTTQLVFSYVPAPGQSVQALATAAANALSGTIRDLAGNAIAPQASGFNNRQPTGIIRVDALAPTLTSFAFSRNSGSLALGESLTLILTFSETVVVPGIAPGSGATSPSLLLNSGGRATYVSGSGTNRLVFSYIPAAGQFSSTLATVNTNALSGAMRDLAGNAVVPTAFNQRRPTGTLGVDTRPRLLTIAQTRDGHEDGSVAAVFTLSKTGPRTSPLTVAYSLGGLATPGVDYSAPTAGTVTFPVGSDTTTLTIPVVDDAQAENTELIIARITAPAGYSLVPGFEKADALLFDNDLLTGLGGSTGAAAPLPFTANLSPSAAAAPLPAPIAATPLPQHNPWAGGADLEPMQAASPLAILRVAEPHA